MIKITFLKKQWAWLPVVCISIAMIIVRMLDLRGTYESPYLATALQFIFTLLVSLVVVYVAGRGFALSGNPGLLWFCSGVLVWGATGYIGGALVEKSVNAAVTIQNLGLLISAICHLTGALRTGMDRKPVLMPGLALMITTTSTAGIIGLLVIVTFADWLPVFFVQGQGGTPFRFSVLGVTAGLFLVSAILMLNRKSRLLSGFLFWYGAGLILLTCGVLGIMFEPVVGGVLSWLGRSAQYLGGAYFAVAAIVSSAEERVWGVSILGKLQISEERYRELIRFAPTGIYEIDFRTRRFTSVNDAMVRITGYTYKELLAMNINDLLDDAGKRLFKARIESWLKGEAPGNNIEYRIRTKSGQYIDAILNVTFTKDEFGKPLGATVIAHDITARKQAEAALRESEGRFRALTENSTLALGVSLPDGTFIYVNKAYENLFGYTLEELNRMNAAELWRNPEDRRQMVDITSSKGSLMDYEVELKRKDGTLFWAMLSVNQVDYGGTMAIMASVYDISMRKQAEEALKKAHDKLEEQVQERTVELAKANKELEAEIAERQHAEEIAITERRRLYDILETLPAMICLLTSDYHIVFANRSFRDRFGESNGRHCYEYCFGRSEPCDFCESYRVLETGKPHHWELVRPDGSVIDAWDFPFTDVDGTPLILEMGIDITKQKNASQYARSLIESSLDPLVTISPDGKITDVNEATIKVTGVSREKLIGTDFSSYFTEPDKAREGYKIAFSNGIVTDYALTIRHKNGTLTDVLYNASVYSDARGNLLGVFAAARDVTALKRTETELRKHQDHLEELVKKRTGELRESEENLKRAQVVASMGNWRLDVRKDELIWSEENYNIFGVQKGTPQTYESFLSMVHPDDRGYVDTKWKAGMAGEDYDIEHRIIVDGKEKWVREKAYLEFDKNGNLSAGFGITQDITYRKQAEEAIRLRTEELAAANRDLESFSYSVAHDLRGPLRSMKGFSNILLEDYSQKLDNDGKDLLNRVSKAADKMSMLIEDLLSLAKISREAFNVQKIDLSTIAKSIINDLRETNPERSIEIVIDEKLPAFADPRLMQIALSNLIGNAWKYSGKNPAARIEIGARLENERIFYVRDNGAGFDIEHAEKLFEPFHRFHSDKQFPGSGIGLAIVRKVIQRHHGRIWAESKTGNGATFYFTLASR